MDELCSTQLSKDLLGVTAPLASPISPPVDLTVLDRTDGDICLPTPKSASKSPNSSRSPKLPSPFTPKGASPSSAQDSATQRRGLLLAGAEQLFTVNGDRQLLVQRAAADFSRSWAEFRAGDSPVTWALCTPQCQNEFISQQLDLLERTQSTAVVDYEPAVSTLLHLVISRDPEKLNKQWPPSPSESLTKMVLAAGCLPSVIQQLRRLFLNIANLTVKPPPDAAAETQGHHEAQCERAWSSSAPWLALTWCLTVCDCSHHDVCTRGELSALALLLLQALGGPTGTDGTTTDHKPAGLVILLYQSLVRTVGEPPPMKATLPGLGVSLKSGAQAVSDYGRQLHKAFPMLAHRSVDELPTPLREGYAVMQLAAQQESDRCEVEGFLDQMFDERGSGGSTIAVAGGFVSGERRRIAESVQQAAETFFATAVSNMGIMITWAMNDERLLEESSGCCVDALVDATAQSVVVLIKNCSTKEQCSQLCRAVLEHNLIEPMLRFVCDRTASASWDDPLEEQDHQGRAVAWDPTPRTFNKVVVSSQQRRALEAATRLIWIVTKRWPATAHKLIELKGPTVFRKLVDNSNGNTKICALRVQKAMLPFVGKRWRQNNMRLVSAVYEMVRPQVSENWLVTTRRSTLINSTLAAEKAEAADGEESVDSVVEWENWCENHVSRATRMVK